MTCQFQALTSSGNLLLPSSYMRHVINGTIKEHHAIKLASQTTQEWEKICPNDETDKELVSKIYKQLL